MNYPKWISALLKYHPVAVGSDNAKIRIVRGEFDQPLCTGRENKVVVLTRMIVIINLYVRYLIQVIQTSLL